VSSLPGEKVKKRSKREVFCEDYREVKRRRNFKGAMHLGPLSGNVGDLPGMKGKGSSVDKIRKIGQKKRGNLFTERTAGSQSQSKKNGEGLRFGPS